MAALSASPGASTSSDPPSSSSDPPSSSPPPPPAPPTSTPPWPPGSSNGSSTGALWTAGLGAFLLVAAAATFVAVRWAQIPEMAKFVALIVLTDVCLVAHHRLRDSLPVTATAVFHLGVLLVPIDVAAVGVRLGWTWPTMVLAQGAAATLTFGLAAVVERSIVLRGAAWLGVVGLAAGIGATTGAPAGVVLAGIALAAVLAHTRIEEGLGDRHLGLEWGSAGWAALAGLAVPLSGAAELGWPAAGVLTDLGLAGEAPHPAAAATGLIAALALGVIAHRHRSLPTALVAVACGLVGGITTWVGLEPSVPASLTAGATLCLLAQAAAWAWRDDAFWDRPTLLLARVSELMVGSFTLGLVGVLFVAPYDPSPSPTTGLAAALTFLTWLVAEAHLQRLAGSGTTPLVPGLAPLPLTATAGPLGAAVAASAAVTLFTGMGVATAVALTVTGTLLVLLAPALSTNWPARADGHQVVAALLLTWAPFACQDQPALAAGLAMLGSLAVAEAAVRASRALRSSVTTGLALLSLVPLGAGALVGATAGGQGALAAGGAVVGAWLLGLVLDRAELSSGMVPLSLYARVGMLAPLMFVTSLPANEGAAVAGLIAALALVDAVRLDEPLWLTGTGIALPFTIVAMAQGAGWTVPEASVPLVLSGVAWLGVGACLPDRWTLPALASAAIASSLGLGLSLDDPTMTATNLLLIGAALTALGVVIDRVEVTAVGVTMATFGLWAHLALAEVTASEPYVAPVAALLLVAGIYAERTQEEASSWLAHAPSVVLLGGAALMERLDGGASWHALIAGAVGVAAVAAGGAHRLAGPLLVGTTLVVAVTVHETLGVTAGLPTWVWLAAGGTALLASGVAMERRGVGPVETGRRLLDVIDERFT